MFITTSVYFLMLFLIFWSYCGYVILLIIFNAIKSESDEKNSLTDNQLKIAIIIPCYNEEDYVDQKIENIKQLDYIQNALEVFFLNGLSTDRTGEEISKRIKNTPNWHLIETNCKGKINQINYGLSRINHQDVDIIVSTDMDTMLAPDVLLRFIAKFNSDDRIAVVGANISPINCIPIEKNYWRDQNILRIVESSVYSSSIVIAPCYAYRASFLDKFPKDCVADDIFIAFKANTEGYLTKYIDSAMGYETRTPDNFEEFFSHKFRKGNAYLIELFRYLYRFPYMPNWWKLIYLTKVLQLSVMPWVLLYFLLSSISLSLSGIGLLRISLFGAAFLFCSLLFTSFLLRMARQKLVTTDKNQVKGVFSLHSFVVSNLILVIIGLSYPFYRQSSSYNKIGSKGK